MEYWIEIHTKDDTMNHNAKEIAKRYCDMIRNDKAVLKKFLGRK